MFELEYWPHMRTWCYHKVDFIKVFKKELKSFLWKFLGTKKNFNKKKILDKKMDVARQILNTQHSTTDLIDLFGKRYRIDENDQTFQWLCLNEVSNYLTFKRICEFAKHGCYCKWKRFDIRVNIKENKNLVNDIRSWSLARKLEDRVGDMCGTIENICMFRIYKLWVITSIILTKTI